MRQIIYMPFSQGFPFVILSALILQAFSGARIGLIPLLYILTFLAIDMIKNMIYLENIYTQIVVGMGFYLVITFCTVILTDTGALEGRALPLIVGAVLSGCISPAMVYIVCRLKVAYES